MDLYLSLGEKVKALLLCAFYNLGSLRNDYNKHWMWHVGIIPLENVLESLLCSCITHNWAILNKSCLIAMWKSMVLCLVVCLVRFNCNHLEFSDYITHIEISIFDTVCWKNLNIYRSYSKTSYKCIEDKCFTILGCNF